MQMADSQQGINNPHLGNVNTPRILELDINRMMIGQNTIRSVFIGYFLQYLTDSQRPNNVNTVTTHVYNLFTQQAG